MKRFAIYILLVFLNIGYTYAQKSKIDVKAMQAALAEVIHKHSNVNGGDTIAAELAKKFKNDPEVLTHIAKAYMQNRTTDKARKYLDKAIKIKPDGYSPALVVKADIFKEESQIDSAALYYEKAVAADSTNAEAYVGYAMMYAKYAGGIDKSIAMLEKARGRVPYFNVDAAIADCYSESGDSEASVNAIGNMDWNLLGEMQIINYCADLYFSKKHSEGAKAADFGANKWPGNPEFKKMQLWHNVKLDRFDEALSSGLKYRQIVPEEEEKALSITLFSLGYAYLGQGNLNETFVYFDKLGALSPESDRFVKNMQSQRAGIISQFAEYNTKNANYDLAIEMYQSIINHYPEADIAYYKYQIADVYKTIVADEFEKTKASKPENYMRLFDAYTAFEKEYPDYVYLKYVLYYHANYLYSILDPENDQQLAEPIYTKLYNVIVSQQNQSEHDFRLLEAACRYLAVTYLQKKDDYIEARAWAERLLDYDITNQWALDFLARTEELTAIKKKKKR